MNQELNNCFQMLTQTQKKSVLSMIKSFLNKPERVSIEQYNKEIAEAEKSIEKGNCISQEDLEEEAKGW